MTEHKQETKRSTDVPWWMLPLATLVAGIALGLALAVLLNVFLLEERDTQPAPSTRLVYYLRRLYDVWLPVLLP